MSHFITLTCPSCGANVKVSDQVGRFRCEYCGNEHVLRAAADAAQAAPVKIRPQAPMPSSVKIEKDRDSALIVQRWFSPKYIAMLIFVIPWDAFLCFWYSMAMGSMSMGGGLPWIFFVFPLGHLAIGIAMTYSTLAGFMNSTIIELTPKELRVWFEPLPWLGEKKVQTSDIQQFYCKEKVTHGKRGSTTVQYELHMVTKDNRQVQLLSNIESPDVALFFEHQLETWMRITDQPVLGEVRKA